MNARQRLAGQLAAYFSGHSESLDQIARQSERELLRIIAFVSAEFRRFGGADSLHEHQEICQQVYLKLWQRRHGPQASVRNELAYLRRLIRNVVCERMRRQGRGAKAADDAELDRLPAPAPPPCAGGATFSERRELLREAVRRLSPNERRIVLLRTHGGAWRDIGRRLQRSPESLRGAYRRALQRLKEQLNRAERAG